MLFQEIRLKKKFYKVNCFNIWPKFNLEMNVQYIVSKYFLYFNFIIYFIQNVSMRPKIVTLNWYTRPIDLIPQAQSSECNLPGPKRPLKERF